MSVNEILLYVHVCYIGIVHKIVGLLILNCISTHLCFLIL